MTAKEVVEKIKGCTIQEERCISNDYAELVLRNDEADRWHSVIVSLCGPAAKPAGIRPQPEDLAITAPHGGIQDNQTLFVKTVEHNTLIVMFWPWQDNMHTTIKVALAKA